MKQVTVELEGIQKSFFTFRGRTPVLGGIGFTVVPGEFFVLLGPSGCGKSTLLNLIAGLEKPDAGRIRIGDRTVADPAAGIFLEPFERDVAMVFQSYALYPHMNVAENIAFPLTNMKTRLSRDEMVEKVRRTAEMLQIGDLLDRKPKELSGGQRQRVAIGRALVREPAVFLLDEPLSNLDARLRMETRAQLKALQQRLGITSIYVTHDQVEAMTLGDRIAVIHDGIVQQLGTPVEVYERPVNTFVARFLGSPPMNLLEGTIKEKETGTLLRTKDFEFEISRELVPGSDTGHDHAVTLGIRPEHINPVPAGTGRFDVTVDVCENLGSEYLLYSLLKDSRIVIRTHDPVEAGQRIGLDFDRHRTRIFAD